MVVLSDRTTSNFNRAHMGQLMKERFLVQQSVEMFKRQKEHSTKMLRSPGPAAATNRFRCCDIGYDENILTAALNYLTLFATMRGHHVKKGVGSACHHRSGRKLCCFSLLLLVQLCCTQEAPFLQVQKFSTDVDIQRTDVCERQKQLADGKVRLRDALVDLDLTVAMTNYKGVSNEEYFFALGDDGKIKEINPGLFVVIMDELSRRARFRWRNSFVAIPPLDSSVDGNKTWTDLLAWEVGHFDIAADYWGRSTQRMALGISFPKGWYDGSVILSWSASDKKSSDKNFWSFLRPFHKTLWLAVAGAIL